jgi:hypothetical protein
MPRKKPPKQHADFSALLATLPALEAELERLRAELPPVDLDALLDELKRDVFGPPATPHPASD